MLFFWGGGRAYLHQPRLLCRCMPLVKPVAPDAVPALHMPAPQEQGGLLTGVVVDSGDGCTHVIPVVDGFVIGSAIRSVPLAGRDVTQHVQQLLRCAGGAQARVCCAEEDQQGATASAAGLRAT